MNRAVRSAVIRGPVPRAERARPGKAADRGSASVYVLVFNVVAWCIGLMVLAYSQVLGAQHRAAGAADLAALAGADQILNASGSPCDEAAAFAAANAARLVGCGTSGAVVDVLVEARPRIPLLPAIKGAKARARAEPVPTGFGR